MAVEFRRHVFALIVAGILCSVSMAVAQQSYPGAALFSYQCKSDTISFFLRGSPVLEVSAAQIVGPLSFAVIIQQNLPIQLGSEAGLWALKSNELQIHINADPDGTKLVLPSSICGPINLQPVATFASRAAAFVEITGTGQGWALAEVSADGRTSVSAGLTGSGQAWAVAQSSHPGAGRYHVVQPGENLFRIALRYHTTVSLLAAINHIPNPNIIYVGQIIYLP